MDHLVSIGFLSREEVRKAGGVNLFWGLLLQEINTVVSARGEPLLGAVAAGDQHRGEWHLWGCARETGVYDGFESRFINPARLRPPHISPQPSTPFL